MFFPINLVTTLFMTGLIWFVQIVHYPLMASIEKASFVSYELRHRRLTTYIVFLPMLLELLSSFALVFYPSAFIREWEAVLGALMVSLIWLSTAFLQLPSHTKLAMSFEPKQHSQLVKTNWLRTILWTFRMFLIMLWLFRLLA